MDGSYTFYVIICISIRNRNEYEEGVIISLKIDGEQLVKWEKIFACLLSEKPKGMPYLDGLIPYGDRDNASRSPLSGIGKNSNQHHYYTFLMSTCYSLSFLFLHYFIFLLYLSSSSQDPYVELICFVFLTVLSFQYPSPLVLCDISFSYPRIITYFISLKRVHFNQFIPPHPFSSTVDSALYFS